ncbi:hypothetical protein [Azospirillum argentinense]|uniref:Uncharacterized protein n=1 Tax=Azospirillum brasilense TaxID=192 RepID=A0A4D8QAQ0_AZOBR|nr:hypothetical protein [Azospirillum argentinense]QCO07358.1 hypothetical protein D3867_36380 [Azospirillum argentinense]
MSHPARTLPPLASPGITAPPPVHIEIAPEEIASVTVSDALSALDLVIHEARVVVSNPTRYEGSAERQQRLHQQDRRHLVRLLAVRDLIAGQGA